MNKRFALVTVAAIIFAAGLVAGISLNDATAAPAEGPRVYELRTYVCHDGKLDDLHARFANHTNRLFVKHGMTLIGYWTPQDEGADNTLVYLIAHENRDAAQASWRAFVNDEDWKKAKAESEADGPIVEAITSKFLVPTDYSPLR